jgi:hypothetical protein
MSVSTLRRQFEKSGRVRGRFGDGQIRLSDVRVPACELPPLISAYEETGARFRNSLPLTIPGAVRRRESLS